MIQMTANTVLKPLSTDDIASIFKTIDSQREYLREWLPFVDYTFQESDTRGFVESVLAGVNEQFSIYHEDRFVGLIGFKDSDFTNKKVEIGYWLSQYEQGKGIVTCAVKELLKYGFETLGFNRVQIRVAVANTKSRRIPERLGFTLEGIERDGELLVDNKYTDLATYSLLKREYDDICKL